MTLFPNKVIMLSVFFFRCFDIWGLTDPREPAPPGVHQFLEVGNWACFPYASQFRALFLFQTLSLGRFHSSQYSPTLIRARYHTSEHSRCASEPAERIQTNRSCLFCLTCSFTWKHNKTLTTLYPSSLCPSPDFDAALCGVPCLLFLRMCECKLPPSSQSFLCVSYYTWLKQTLGMF